MNYRLLHRLRLQAHRTPTSIMNQPLGDKRFTSSSSSRTYTDALSKLSLLASNKKVTSLFENAQPPSASHSSPPASSSSSPKKDLNATAIPEMLTWLRRAGYSQSDLCKIRHIHVAGTKGKGSVCAYATAMLKQHCSTVGTYTSPHLVSPRERIAIDGEPVSQEVFAQAFFQLWDRFTAAAKEEGSMTDVEAEGPGSKPFYFRFLTILAWHIFWQRGVENVVMECGIGGEYDATNVLPAEAVSAAVVTQLGIDHVGMLGGTVEEIAWHKAGVFKPGKKAFTRLLGDGQSVMDVLRMRAQEKGATLVEVDDGAVSAWGGIDVSQDYQKRNQALAVMAVMEHLGLNPSLCKVPEAMVAGLKSVRLRGRGEMVKDSESRTMWCLDGAHTKDSLEEVARYFFRDLGADESVVLVFNQQDRDASQLLTDFVDAVKEQVMNRRDVFSHAVFTTNCITQPEGLVDMSVQNSAAGTMSRLVEGCEVKVFDNAGHAIEEVRRIMAKQKGYGKRKRVLVTGSMHLVGAVIQILEPESCL